MSDGCVCVASHRYDVPAYSGVHDHSCVIDISKCSLLCSCCFTACLILWCWETYLLMPLLRTSTVLQKSKSSLRVNFLSVKWYNYTDFCFVCTCSPRLKCTWLDCSVSCQMNITQSSLTHWSQQIALELINWGCVCEVLSDVGKKKSKNCEWLSIVGKLFTRSCVTHSLTHRLTVGVLVGLTGCTQHSMTHAHTRYAHTGSHCILLRQVLTDTHSHTQWHSHTDTHCTCGLKLRSS